MNESGKKIPLVAYLTFYDTVKAHSDKLRLTHAAAAEVCSAQK